MKSGIRELILDFGLSFLIFVIMALIILLAGVDAEEFLYVTF
jgi:hypothetical protein